MSMSRSPLQIDLRWECDQLPSFTLSAHIFSTIIVKLKPLHKPIHPYFPIHCASPRITNSPPPTPNTNRMLPLVINAYPHQGMAPPTNKKALESFSDPSAVFNRSLNNAYGWKLSLKCTCTPDRTVALSRRQSVGSGYCIVAASPHDRCYQTRPLQEALFSVP